MTDKTKQLTEWRLTTIMERDVALAKLINQKIAQARQEEREKVLALIDKMKNPNDYSTSSICDQCGNDRTNATLAELRQQIKEMK
jgi:hypothetical protein